MSLILLLLIDVNGPERHHAINIFRRGCGGGFPPQTPPFMVASSFSKMLEGSCGWVGVLVCGWVSGTKRGDGVFLTRFGWRDLMTQGLGPSKSIEIISNPRPGTLQIH